LTPYNNRAAKYMRRDNGCSSSSTSELLGSIYDVTTRNISTALADTYNV